MLKSKVYLLVGCMTLVVVAAGSAKVYLQRIGEVYNTLGVIS